MRGFADGGWQGEFDSPQEILSDTKRDMTPGLGKTRDASGKEYTVEDAKTYPLMQFLRDVYAQLGPTLPKWKTAEEWRNTPSKTLRDAAVEGPGLALSAMRAPKPVTGFVNKAMNYVVPGGLGAASALGDAEAQPSKKAEPPKSPSEQRASDISKLQAEIGQHQQGLLSAQKEIGATKFRGVGEEAGLARQKAMEEAARPFNDAIAQAQKRIAELRAVDDEKQNRLVRAEREANALRVHEQGRGTPFNKTLVGEQWERLGPVGPAIVGAALAAAGRLGHGPKAGWKGALPLVEGTGGGALAANMPTAWDAFFSPVDNPNRRAHEIYGEELKIADHPRAQEWLDYAKTLPEFNPVREKASREFWDPWHASKRMAFGALEGLSGAGLGFATAAGGERAARFLSGLLPRGTTPSLTPGSSGGASGQSGRLGTASPAGTPPGGAAQSKTPPSTTPAADKPLTPVQRERLEKRQSKVAKKEAERKLREYAKKGSLSLLPLGMLPSETGDPDASAFSSYGDGSSLDLPYALGGVTRRHHSHFQPRERAGRFAGGPVYPETYEAGRGNAMADGGSAFGEQGGMGGPPWISSIMDKPLGSSVQPSGGAPGQSFSPPMGAQAPSQPDQASAFSRTMAAPPPPIGGAPAGMMPQAPVMPAMPQAPQPALTPPATSATAPAPTAAPMPQKASVMPMMNMGAPMGQAPIGAGLNYKPLGGWAGGGPVEFAKPDTRDPGRDSGDAAWDETNPMFPGRFNPTSDPNSDASQINLNLQHRERLERALKELGRQHRAHGGAVHVGPVVGATGGRSDKLPVDVENGAYVVPADVVSALGEGNTLAGMEVLKKRYGNTFKAAGAMASGGAVPIMISDGEYVVAPGEVSAEGGGDLDRGHKILDSMVRKIRAQNIRRLASLPPPAK